MSTFNAYQSIDEGLRYLANRLNPIISETLVQHLGGHEWTLILSELDRSKGRQGRSYIATDLQAQLRVLTERLGGLGFPFDDPARHVSTLGSELRILRNRWAHGDELETLDAWRAHDFSARLLEYFKDWEGVKHARDLRAEVLKALAEEGGLTALPESLDSATSTSEPLTPEPLTPAPADPSPENSLPQPPAAASVPVTHEEPQAEPEPNPAPPTQKTEASTRKASANKEEDEDVKPDTAVYTRVSGAETPTIGSGRYEYEAWETIIVGDSSVLDALPKKTAKEKVRSLAAEIAEFEGPIHLERLTRLVALGFNLQRLAEKRRKKLERQVHQCGLHVDDMGYVWPSDINPDTWDEFRPNTSDAARPFTEISPTEIANAYIFFGATQPELVGAELDAAVLRTFGRKRRTETVLAHLGKGKDLAFTRALVLTSAGSGERQTSPDQALEAEAHAAPAALPVSDVPAGAPSTETSSESMPGALPESVPEAVASAEPADPMLRRMEHAGVVAYGRIVPGGFLLLAGSHVRPRADFPEKALQRIIDARTQHAGSLSADNVVTEDIFFRSPSGAASFVAGTSLNGPLVWR